MKQTKTALVVGASGGIGSEVAHALTRHGWKVRGMSRHPPASPSPHILSVQGDALRAGEVMRAAQGATVIVHAVNPPGYRQWGQTVLPMLDNTILAARRHGARIVLPGTIYNYGPDAFPLLQEASPQHPTTTKGRLRVAMEQRLEAAAASGVPSLILRCGDFFGPRPGNNWFTQGLIKPGRPLTRLYYPGPPRLGHAWAYLPDVAETMARLLAHDAKLAPFARFHFGGHWLDGHQLCAALAGASGQPAIGLARFPWPLLALAAPFNETVREIRKMRYLWQAPLRLDPQRLQAFLGDIPHTPIEVALRATLRGAGCLPPATETQDAAEQA